MANIQQLRQDIEQILGEVKSLLLSSKWNINNEEHRNMWNKMVSNAVELHKAVNPKHRRQLIENRGCSPDNPEFYNHIHSIESMLRYIDDPEANDDPTDLTIGQEFKLEIYSRRWGHTDRYRVIRTQTGWNINHITTGGACDKSGNPGLFDALRHESINYPEALGGYLEWLWEQANEEGLTHEQVQEGLDTLADWINICETNSPKGLWQPYK